MQKSIAGIICIVVFFLYGIFRVVNNLWQFKRGSENLCKIMCSLLQVQASDSSCIIAVGQYKLFLTDKILTFKTHLFLN